MEGARRSCCRQDESREATMRLTRRSVAVALGCFAAGVARAAATRPVRIIWPYAAGSAGDATARLVAEILQAGLERPVLVENKPGAAGRLGVQAVREAPADGTTLPDRADGDLSACLRQ